MSETLYYGCLRYGFQGWRIHFWHQIIKIPMFIHDLIDQLWQKLRYHQNCRISPIWPQKWIPHPQKPYRRHPYVMGLLYWGQSYQSPGWNVQDLEQAGMHHISALPILEQALPWSRYHFLWSLGRSLSKPKFSKLSETFIMGVYMILWYLLIRTKLKNVKIYCCFVA